MGVPELTKPHTNGRRERPAPVVKWISRRSPEPEVQVRFLAGAFSGEVGAPISLAFPYMFG